MSAADIDAATAAIKWADEKASLLALLPSLDELFPRMRKESLDYYADVLAIESVDGFTGQPFGWWEQQMGPRTRAYLARLAGVRQVVEQPETPWQQISVADKARLVARFMWLRELVNGMQPPVPPFIFNHWRAE